MSTGLYTYLQWKKRALMMGSGSGKWWLPPGILESECLAAYRCKGVETAAQARVDLTGHGYTLYESTPNTRTYNWTTEAGYDLGSNISTSGILQNDDLKMYAGIKSIIVCYTGLSNTNINNANGVIMAAPHANNGTGIQSPWLGAVFRPVYFSNGTGRSIGNDTDKYPGFAYDWVRQPWTPDYSSRLRYYLGNAKVGNSGVLGMSLGGSLSGIYYNGAAQASTYNYVYAESVSTVTWPDSPYVIGGPFVLVAAAFYTKALNEEQHNFVYEGMMQI